MLFRKMNIKACVDGCPGPPSQNRHEVEEKMASLHGKCTSHWPALGGDGGRGRADPGEDAGREGTLRCDGVRQAMGQAALLTSSRAMAALCWDAVPSLTSELSAKSVPESCLGGVHGRGSQEAEQHGGG